MVLSHSLTNPRLLDYEEIADETTISAGTFSNITLRDLVAALVLASHAVTIDTKCPQESAKRAFAFADAFLAVRNAPDPMEASK